jgi:hypothetical protein
VDFCCWAGWRPPEGTRPKGDTPPTCHWPQERINNKVSRAHIEVLAQQGFHQFNGDEHGAAGPNGVDVGLVGFEGSHHGLRGLTFEERLLAVRHLRHIDIRSKSKLIIVEYDGVDIGAIYLSFKAETGSPIHMCPSWPDCAAIMSTCQPEVPSIGSIGRDYDNDCPNGLKEIHEDVILECLYCGRGVLYPVFTVDNMI